MPSTDFNSTFWTDGFVQGIHKDAKLLFAYLITSPHKNVAGLYHITIKTILDDTGLKRSEFDKALDSLNGKVCYDAEQDLVWVVNHVRRTYLKSATVSPKIVKAIEKNLLSAPIGHSFVGEFLNKYSILDIPYRYPIDGVSIPYKLRIGLGEGLEDSKDVDFKVSLLQEALKTFNPALLTQEVITAITEWEKHKREKGNSMTKTTADKQAKFLSVYEPKQIIDILNQSIRNGWTGLFELKRNVASQERRI